MQGLGNVCHPILSEANKSFSDIHVIDEQVFLFLMLPANERYFMYLSIRNGWVSATIAHLYFSKMKHMDEFCIFALVH